MDWRTISHNKSSDGKTENIYCELFLDFSQVGFNSWNQTVERPIIKIHYHDFKHDRPRWINWISSIKGVQHRHKMCEIYTDYFQSHPKTIIYSSPYSNSRIKYEDFTLYYCQQQAVKIFKERLHNVLEQLEQKSLTREVLTEKSI